MKTRTDPVPALGKKESNLCSEVTYNLTACTGVLTIPYPDPTEKKQLKGRHFSSDAEVTAAAETWLDGQISECFLVAFKI